MGATTDRPCMLHAILTCKHACQNACLHAAECLHAAQYQRARKARSQLTCRERLSSFKGGLTKGSIDGSAAGLDKGPPEDVVGNAGKPEGLNVAQLARIIQHQCLTRHVHCQRHCTSPNTQALSHCTRYFCSKRLQDICAPSESVCSRTLHISWR